MKIDQGDGVFRTDTMSVSSLDNLKLADWDFAVKHKQLNDISKLQQQYSGHTSTPSTRQEILQYEVHIQQAQLQRSAHTGLNLLSTVQPKSISCST